MCRIVRLWMKVVLKFWLKWGSIRRKLKLVILLKWLQILWNRERHLFRIKNYQERYTNSLYSPDKTTSKDWSPNFPTPKNPHPSSTSSRNLISIWTWTQCNPSSRNCTPRRPSWTPMSRMWRSWERGERWRTRNCHEGGSCKWRSTRVEIWRMSLKMNSKRYRRTGESEFQKNWSMSFTISVRIDWEKREIWTGSCTPLDFLMSKSIRILWQSLKARQNGSNVTEIRRLRDIRTLISHSYFTTLILVSALLRLCTRRWIKSTKLETIHFWRKKDLHRRLYYLWWEMLQVDCQMGLGQELMFVNYWRILNM